MFTEKFEWMIQERKPNEKFENSFVLKKNLSRKCKALFLSLEKMPPDQSGTTWLKENVHFLCDIAKKIHFERKSVRCGMISLLKELLLEGWKADKTDDFLELLEKLRPEKGYQEVELYHLGPLYQTALIFAIEEAANKRNELIPPLISAVHHAGKINFEQIRLYFSPIERILRSDPAGIYPKMTRETQARYRENVLTLSKKAKMEPSQYVSKILDRAISEEKHIGHYLWEKRKNIVYFPAVFTLFFLFFCAFFYFERNIFLILFCLLPLYFISKSLADFVFAKACKPRPLPAMRIDTVSEENKCCVVITTLIGKPEDISSACEKLNQYRLNNKSDQDHLYFGLLCDLPQGKTSFSDKDKRLASKLEQTIEKLNEEDPCYFAMLRKRSYHKSEDAYVGYERKRGAIEQFVAYLNTGKLSKDTLHYGRKDLISTKYMITLDQDTELGIGQAKRLIGMMSHPLNRPVISGEKGRRRVVSGHGIIQPKISSSLLSKITTPYAKIFSNGSGEIRYASASFDTMQTLFGEGNFCGKGIIDVESFYQVLDRALPPQRILSHDMPEGALMRAGMACDEFFVDSDPQDAVSHYKRLHRWIRGDVQNLFLLHRLPKLRRFFAVENVLRYFVPISELGIIITSLLLDRKVLLPFFVILVYHFQPVLEVAFSTLISGNIQNFSRRFKTKMRNVILNSFYKSFLSISAVLHEALYFSDAIIRSLYRMTVSKKKLLEWQVYSPFSKSKNDLLFFLSSILVSSCLLFFVKTNLQFILFLLFLFYPFLMSLLARKYVISDRLSDRERAYLLNLAKNEFLFFDNLVNSSSSYLPPDNIQFSPVEKIANRTSPTNIGLYLVTLVSACDLGFISEREMVKRISLAFTSIEKMEHYEGHLFNWYDLSTLGVIGERFISTVDNGNFLASLMVVKNALCQLESKDSQILELIAKIDREIDNFNFNLIFDRAKGLFYVGVFPDDPERSTSYYDLYMSEARITSFVGIALGKISPLHWRNLSRPLLSFAGRVGVGSWTGTCFEYYMPTLFLPVIENSMEDESLDFALYCQKKFSANSTEGSIFGISESGYHTTDDAGNLQYFAFGTPYLSIYERESYKKVISPYSTFLMLIRGDFTLVDNLKRIEKIGGVGPFGFYEALDFETNFMDDFSVVKSYMSHHKGMSIIALTNLLCNNSIQKRFMSSPMFRAKAELLAERFPIEGRLLKKKREAITIQRGKGALSQGKISKLVDKPKSAVFTDGKLTMLALRSGKNRFLIDGEDLFDPEKSGISVKVITSVETYQFNCKNSKISKVNFGPGFAEYILISGKVSIILRIELISGEKAFLLRLEVNGISEAYSVEIDFDFIYQKEREYTAHPAFHNLALEAESGEKCLILSRRLTDGKKEIQIQTNKRFKTKLSGFREEAAFPPRMLYQPKVVLSFQCNEIGKTVIPLIFSASSNANLLEDYLDGSFHLKSHYQTLGEERQRRLDKICQMDRSAYRAQEEILSLMSVKQKHYLDPKIQPIRKEELWKYGISGDYPILTFVIDENNRSYKKILGFIKAYKKLQIAGFGFVDLVILHPAGDGYFDEFRSELNQLIAKTKSEFLLGKHPGIHVIPYRDDREKRIFSYLSAKYFAQEEGEEIERLFDVQIQNKKFIRDEKEECVGAFLENGFLIDKKKFSPTVPFSHVVSDPYVGFVCDQNSLGFTWFRNSGLNRISKWENRPNTQSGEKVYLLVDETLVDLISFAEKVKYLERVAIYEGNLFGMKYSVFITAVSIFSGKLIFVKFDRKPEEDYQLIFSFVPALGQKLGRNILFSEKDPLVVMKPMIYDEYECGAYFYSGEKCSLFSRQERVYFSFQCKEENTLLLGGFSSETHLSFIAENLKKIKINELLDRETECNFKLPEKKFMPMEFWSLYQAVHSRFFGRTGLYQSSGAYGFRDQLQDSLVFLDIDPDITRRHIIRCAAHQFLDGDVLHWWHTIRKHSRWDPGIRSRCSDDYLWLLFATGEYIRKTCDESLLDVKIPFLQGETLKQNEDERYINPEICTSGNLREHLEKAALLFMDRGLGEHSLPFIGSGDWNDGMNKITGESVWLGFFGAICINRCLPYFTDETRERALSFLDKLKNGLESSFNGAWFVRAYGKDGLVFGNDVSMQSECSIDLITQAFSAFYQCEFAKTKFSLDDKMIESALKSAQELLVNSTARTIRLFTKPFVSTEPSPGYIQRYCAGVRENGGQYTHAAVWFALSQIQFGKMIDSDELVQLGIKNAKLLDPSYNLSVERFEKYQREPYVLCGDIYDAPGFRGHGGWSWYTGAAGWYHRLLKLVNENKEKLPN